MLAIRNSQSPGITCISACQHLFYVQTNSTKIYMAQYVVHKIGFFYTDENFEVGVEKGPVMGITRSLDEALAIKKRRHHFTEKNRWH
jgi:hypothetical protein